MKMSHKDHAGVGAKILGMTIFAIFVVVCLALVSFGYLAIAFLVNALMPWGDFRDIGIVMVYLISLSMGFVQLISQAIALRFWRIVFAIILQRSTDEQSRHSQFTCRVLVSATVAASVWVMFGIIFEYWQASLVATAMALLIEQILALSGVTKRLEAFGDRPHPVSAKNADDVRRQGDC